jgi:endonuclease/exonuclease/phosphatase family metal-dependent hydrolase
MRKTDGIITRSALAACACMFLFSCGSVKNYMDAEGPSLCGSYSEQCPDSCDTIKVVSYNIKFGERIEEAREEIRRQEVLRNPDIVLLQEMDGKGVESIAREGKFNFVYFPASLHGKHDRDFGNAILSRWPIRDEQKIILPHVQPISKQLRIATAATVVIDTTRIRVYSVHTETSWLGIDERIEQMDSILASVPAEFEHIVIGGDFNTVSAGTIRRVEQRFTDAGFTRASRGVDFTATEGPFGLLELDLDHIFVKGFRVLSVGAGEKTEVSDHLPLWLILSID